MNSFNRRYFLKATGAGLLPALLPLSSLAMNNANEIPSIPATGPLVKFNVDGEMFDPGDYLNELQKMHVSTPIARDFYGRAGTVEQLEKG